MVGMKTDENGLQLEKNLAVFFFKFPSSLAKAAVT